MNKREFVKTLLAASALSAAPKLYANNQTKIHRKKILSSGQFIPVIGMGSFVTFNFPSDFVIIRQRSSLIDQFFSMGGELIDSSPMYGASEKNLGLCINSSAKDKLFSATKVWTSSVGDGVSEIEASRKLWKVDQFNLLQVHNLVSWEGHLKTLFDMKDQGKLNYVGVTTSHGRRHKELEKIMMTQPIDFVQATYNVVDREVEQRILPIAKERGIAFIANRPFQRGNIINQVNQHPLPGFAKELNCDNWASLLLKYIVSHPAVTCTIPATSKHEHLLENMSALIGEVPDAEYRIRIEEYVSKL